MPRQFDIVENLNDHSRRQYPYLLILQHDRTASLQSVVVAPMVESPGEAAVARLHPTLTVLDRRYILLTEEMAATPSQVLGRVVGSADDRRYEIIAALDLLFTGI